MIPNSMGGAMDLVAGVQRVIVVMDHVSKSGDPKILKNCSLPLTGQKVVDRIITDLGIFDIAGDGIRITAMAPGVSLQEIESKTDATIG